MSEQSISKRCSKCKQNKPLPEFSKSRTTKDGLQTYCNSCKKLYQQQYQQTPKGRASNSKRAAKYRNSSKGKASIRAYRQSERGRVVHRKTVAKHNALNLYYAKAKHAVESEIRAGRFLPANTRPCHYCPTQAKEYHHWQGYEPKHWLDVVPACLECHRKEHRKTA